MGGKAMSTTVIAALFAWFVIDFAHAYVQRKQLSAMNDRIDVLGRRLDVAAHHRGILTSRIDRLSRLETDGK